MLGRHDLRMVPAATLAWLAAVILVDSSVATALVTGVVAVMVAAVAWTRFPPLAVVGMVIALIAVGLGWRLAMIDSSPLVAWAEGGAVVTVELHLRDDPLALSDSTSTLWHVSVRQVEHQGQTVLLRARATAFVTPTPSSADVAPPLAGDRVRAKVRLAEARRSDDVATLTVLRWEPVGSPTWWWTAAAGVREAIRDSTSRHQDAAAALVPALVTGDESGVDDLVRAEFRRSGLTHLLAVSGANLTIVLAMVLGSLRMLGFRRFQAPVAVLVAIAFVLVARPEPSVQRAAVMGIVGVLGLGRAHSPSGLRALAWAVVVLLFCDPWLGRQAGFVLSVSATAGILVLSPPLVARFETWMPRFCAVALAVPLAAQLACLPMVASLTGEVSLVSLAANVLAAVTVAPATVGGLLAGLLHLVWEPLAWPMAELGWLSARWIVTVARWSAEAPGAAVDWPVPVGWLIPVAVLATVGLLRHAHRPGVMIAVLVVLAGFVVRPAGRAWQPPATVVVACDVGQGDALVVPVGPGAGIVFDVGEHPEPIDRCLRDLRIRSVPLLVLSHADADHVGGWRGLARGREVAQVLVGPSGGPDLGAPTDEARAGEVFRVGDAEVEVLWPSGPMAGASANDQSLVVRVEVLGTTMLFTGDLSAKTQRRLASADVEADVLKVAHHGSADFWPGLLDAVSPSVATIGVGRGNRHDHPREEVIEALSSRGIATWRTDEHGTHAVVREGSTLTVVRR